MTTARAMFIEVVDPGEILVMREAKPGAVQFGAKMAGRSEVVADVDPDPRCLPEIRSVFYRDKIYSGRRGVFHQLEMAELAETGRCPSIFQFGSLHVLIGLVPTD